MLREAQILARDGKSQKALAKAETLTADLERQIAGGDKPGRWGMEALRLAARIARDDLLGFCDRMSEAADTDYWTITIEVPLKRLPCFKLVK